MKNIVTLLLSMFIVFGAVAQDNNGLPNTSVKDLKTGKKIAFNEAFEPGKVTVVSFWATWCVPCIQEIKNVRKKLPDWKKEADFNYMTVSIDESKSEALVKGYAKSQGWDFRYLLDANSDLKRSLNFQNVPFTIIVDKNGKVVYSHTGYEEGTEDEVWEKVKEHAK